MKLFAQGLLLLVLAGQAGAAVFPKPQGYVNDYASALEPGFKEKLEAGLRAASGRGGPELAVVVVQSTAPEETSDYAVGLLRAWGLGKKGKNNGLVFLLALKDRRLWISVGYGLEGALPDGWVGRLRDGAVVPLLKAGKIQEAIWTGSDSLLKKAGDPGLDPGTGLPPMREGEEGLPDGWLIFGLGMAALMFVAIWLESRKQSRRRKIFGSRWSGWSDGSGGGFGGGGSGGGFSGFGGGSGGGGGAGGSW